MSDATALRELRVFISSPGDVSEERVLAAQLIERLRLEFAGSIRLTTVLWEHEPLFAHAGFQDQLPLPSECDLVLSILWSRIGTRLHPRFARPADGRVPTGTEFEIEDALESYRRIGRPNLLVFVKDAAVEGDLRAADIQERVTQRKDLEEFIRLALIERPALGLAAHHRFASSWEFARRVEDQLRTWLQQRVGIDLKAQAAWRESPYRGLEVFEAEHRLIYCGRGRAISQVLGRLRTLAAAMAAWANRPPAERATATDASTLFDEPRMFLLVQGMSGNGKSSLVRAGILPLLQVGAVEGVGEWRQALLRPSDRDGDLVLTLAHALTAVGALPELVTAGETVESLAADLRAAPNGTLGRLKGYVAQAAAKRGLQAKQVRLVVFIDQLEELFTDSRIDAEARRTFCRMLDSLASGQQAWVVATLRSDFAHRCEEIPELGDLRRGRVFELDKPRTDELQEMIEEPAKLAGLRFEEKDGERLSRQILRDAEGNAEVLPLLEYALTTLYERRDDEGRLTWAAYAAAGGLQGTLVGEAERVLQQLGSAGEPALTPVLRELVGVDDSGTATRRRVANAVFDADPDQRRLVDALVRARLLAAHADESGPSLSVAHEALITHWPRVTAWLLSEKRLLVQRHELAQRALSWQRADRADDFLLSAGLPLLQALEVRDAGFVLDALQQVFLEQSLAADTARERQKQEREQTEAARRQEMESLRREQERQKLAAEHLWLRRRKRITAVALVASLVATVVMAFLVREANTQGAIAQQHEKQAKAQELEARNSLARFVTERSLASLERQQPQSAIRYALLAGTEFPERQNLAREVLARIVNDDAQPSAELSGAVGLLSAYWRGETAVVERLGPTGLETWDVLHQKQLLAYPLKNTERVCAATMGVALICDGNKLKYAVSLASGDVLSEFLPQTFIGEPALSLNGTRILTIADGAARVWNVTNATQIDSLPFDTVLSGGEEFVAALSPDGRVATVVRSDGPGLVKIWRVGDQSTIKTFPEKIENARCMANTMSAWMTHYEISCESVMGFEELDIRTDGPEFTAETSNSLLRGAHYVPEFADKSDDVTGPAFLKSGAQSGEFFIDLRTRGDSRDSSVDLQSADGKFRVGLQPGAPVRISTPDGNLAVSFPQLQGAMISNDGRMLLLAGRDGSARIYARDNLAKKPMAQLELRTLNQVRLSGPYFSESGDVVLAAGDVNSAFDGLSLPSGQPFTLQPYSSHEADFPGLVAANGVERLLLRDGWAFASTHTDDYMLAWHLREPDVAYRIEWSGASFRMFVRRETSQTKNADETNLFSPQQLAELHRELVGDVTPKKDPRTEGNSAPAQDPGRSLTEGAVFYSPDARIRARYRQDGSIDLEGAESGFKLANIRAHDNSKFKRLTFSDDGRRLALISASGYLTVWDLSVFQRPYFELAQLVCVRDLALDEEKHFSEAEIDADPFLKELDVANDQLCRP